MEYGTQNSNSEGNRMNFLTLLFVCVKTEKQICWPSLVPEWQSMWNYICSYTIIHLPQKSRFYTFNALWAVQIIFGKFNTGPTGWKECLISPPSLCNQKWINVIHIQVCFYRNSNNFGFHHFSIVSNRVRKVLPNFELRSYLDNH